MKEAVLGYEQITASTLASASVLQNIPANTERAKVQAAGGSNVRYTLDGSTTPTSTKGHVLVNGEEPIKMLRWELENAKFILESGTPSVEVTYYGTDDPTYS